MGLIILDINGVLLTRINTKYAKYRPGIKSFLKYCYENHDVGFYTSAERKNALRLLDKILNKKQKSETKFVLFREHTTHDPYGEFSYSTLKHIDLIFDSKDINPHKLYNEYNTIICDDSYSKVRDIDSKNVLIVDKFEGDSADEVLASLPQQIDEKFANLTYLSMPYKLIRHHESTKSA